MKKGRRPAVRAPAPPAPPAPPVSTGAGESSNSLGAQYLTEFAPLLSLGEAMRPIRQLVEDVAATNATVLVLGESGVGKDVVARAIHAASLRRSGPYVKVNCAAMPPDLLESEFFGHEKGAFTGAYRLKPGKFEFANSGTICLDEIGDLPLALQAKLLHVLQDFQFARVGGDKLIQVDVRVIATTNRNLEAAIASGTFREDLYYRVNVVEIRVPPLRERPDAIPSLAARFIAHFNQQYARHAVLSVETVRLMETYAWPGNVRELENFVRRFVVLGDARQAHESLLSRIRGSAGEHEPAPAARDSVAAPGAAPSPRVANLYDLKIIARRAAREAERKALLAVLERVRWNRAAAARILKVSYKTLLTKLTECGITPRKTPPTG